MEKIKKPRDIRLSNADFERVAKAVISLHKSHTAREIADFLGMQENPVFIEEPRVHDVIRALIDMKKINAAAVTRASPGLRHTRPDPKTNPLEKYFKTPSIPMRNRGKHWHK
ncbi:MAG: hypothetical protein V1494_02050 [Candidatus Diapherotrites archaeon]